MSRSFRASGLHATVLTLVLVAACARSTGNRAPSGTAGAGSGGAGQSGGREGGAGTGGRGAGRGGSAGDDPGQGGEDHGGAPGQGGSGAAGSGGQSPIAGSSGNGGTEQGGGRSGSGGQAPLPLPEGCEPRGRTESETECSLGVFCGSDPNLIDCHRMPSGRWKCTCELENNARIYEIDGAPGIASCAVAAGLCSFDELELGDETCNERTDTSDENYCDMELACERPTAVDFAPGVDAWLMEYGTAECGREGSAHPFDCRCGPDEAPRAFGLLAEGGDEACRPLIEFCRTGMQPTFDGETTCFDTDASSTEGQCLLSQACATPMPLTEDVNLAAVVRRGASCDTGPMGARCNCSKQVNTGSPDVIGWESFAFELGGSVTASTCDSAVLNCNDDAVIELEGEVDCQPTAQNAGTDFCTADLDCSQAASVDGRAIVGKGRLGVYCRRAATGEPWFCSCASNDESTILELGVPQSTGWEACSQAPARCLEQMAVVIGPYGDYMEPPDPLPEQSRVR